MNIDVGTPNCSLSYPDRQLRSASSTLAPGRALLGHLGADIESAHGARFHMKLNKAEAYLHHPHNSNTCSRTDIKTLHEFLTHAGITLSAYEAGET